MKTSKPVEEIKNRFKVIGCRRSKRFLVADKNTCCIPVGRTKGQTERKENGEKKGIEKSETTETVWESMR